MTATNCMNRWKAGALHLLASLIVIGAIAGYVWLLWTPNGLWVVAGVDRPLLIVFGAVLLVGPGLTTLVHKPGNRPPKSDLIAIYILQLAFLAYGLWMLGRTRPVFLVAAVDRFEVVFANEIDPTDLADAPLQYQELSWTGPRLVGLKRAYSMSNPALLDTTRQPAYYTDFKSYSAILESRAKPLDGLMAQSPRGWEMVTRALAHLGRAPAATRFVPVTSRRKGSAVMLIDVESAQPLRALPLDPWLSPQN